MQIRFGAISKYTRQLRSRVHLLDYTSFQSPIHIASTN